MAKVIYLTGLARSGFELFTNSTFWKGVGATGLVKVLGAAGETFNSMDNIVNASGAKIAGLYMGNLNNLELNQLGDQTLYGFAAIGAGVVTKKYVWPALKEIPGAFKKGLGKAKNTYNTKITGKIDVLKGQNEKLASASQEIGREIEELGSKLV